MMVLAAVTVAATIATATTAPPSRPAGWNRLAPGLELRLIDGGTACRRGSRTIAVARFEPAKWRLEPFTIAEEPGTHASLDIDGWQRRTHAAVVLNAGQYFPNHVPMGLFLKDRRNLGSSQLKNWKALLVSEPRGTRRSHKIPRAAILDLDHDEFVLADAPWRFIVQSFMLLDRDGGKRVRRSDWVANRTAVAVDGRGRILLIHTEGGWSLWDLADWLARSDLDVTQAMAMDGGFESQICVRWGGDEYLSFGQWHIDDRGDRSTAGLRVKLPAVIAVLPRR